LIGTGRLSGNETSTLQSPNKSGAWSQPTGREHELSQCWNLLEARIGKEWLAYLHARESFSGR
jgi:hypothetical protein